MNPVWKKIALAAGLLAILACFCTLPLSLAWLVSVADSAGSESHDALYVGMVWCGVVLVLAASGYSLTVHAMRSQLERSSRALRLPPLWAFLWGLPLALVLGEWLRRADLAGLFFPPLFALAGGLPPLAALAWTVRQSPQVSWRQASVAAVLGATFAAALALFLEIILPGILFALVEGLFDLFRTSWEYLLDQLAGGEVSRALSSYGFIFALVEIALVAPLAEEFAKPLFCLPLIRHVETPRQAFLVGAAAGAGFAALENLLYTGFGVHYWGGVLILRTIGAGVHLMGSGWVALGWYRWNRRSAGGDASSPGFGFLDWLQLYGAAVAVHALWNGGSLLFAALIGANFFGNAPEVDVLGVANAGVLLALLLVLGSGAWLALPLVARRLPGLEPETGAASPEATAEMPPSSVLFLPSDLPVERVIAIWALLCLIIALPLGLATLILRGGLR